MKEGRPTKYSETVRDRLNEYIDSCTDVEYPITDKDGNIVNFKVRANIPTVEGFANFINVNKTTLYEWESNYPEFSNDISRLRQEQASRLINKGLSGEYNPTIAKVLLAKQGYRDAIDTDITSKGEQINTIDPAAQALAKEYEEKLKGSL